MKWLFCNSVNDLFLWCGKCPRKTKYLPTKSFAIRIEEREEKVELGMLLTLLLHMNLINDLPHLSLAQWVGRPTNVWHPLARDITNITSSTHYIPTEISQWCIFFPLEAPGSSLQSYPTLLQGEWLEWRHWFSFPRAKRACATPKKGKR